MIRLRLTIATVFVAAIFVCTPVYSQNETAPSAEQQELQAQMRQNFTTIMQNMQEKGVNPQQFFQQLQDGADPADIQKQLIDQGIIDQKMVTQMQTTMQKLMSTSIKDRLQATDAEWLVLEPLIQKVQAASAAVGQQGMGMQMAGFMTKQSDAAIEFSKAKKALATAVKDPAATPDQYNAVLKAFRDAREKTRVELTDAQHQLLGALSLRQEGVLMLMGFID